MYRHVYVIPDDAAARPELAPLMDAGIRPGDTLFGDQPTRWRLHRVMENGGRPTPAMLRALARLTPVDLAEVASVVARARPHLHR
jgi:hypothetical protein